MEDQAFQCPICLQAWQESVLNFPRVLDCGHTVCLQCISQFLKEQPGLSQSLRIKEAIEECPN